MCRITCSFWGNDVAKKGENMSHFTTKEDEIASNSPSKSKSSILSKLKKVAVLAVIVWCGVTWFTLPSTELTQFATLPVLQNGRIKPLDTVARNAILLIQEKQAVRYEGKKIQPSEWLYLMIFQSKEANELPIFKITDPAVLGVLDKSSKDGKYFSFTDIAPFYSNLYDLHQSIVTIPNEKRTRSQKAIMSVYNKLLLYIKLQNTFKIAGIEDWANFTSIYTTDLNYYRAEIQALLSDPGYIPSSNIMEILNIYFAQFNRLNELSPYFLVYDHVDDEWSSVGQAYNRSLSGSDIPEVATYFSQMFASPSQVSELQSPPRSQSLFSRVQRYYREHNPKLLNQARLEAVYNQAAVLYKGLLVYLFVFIFILIAWVFSRSKIVRWGYPLLASAFALHTLGILMRMIIQGRPPITNLYTSAVFVGWMACALGLFLEKRNRQGYAALVSAIVGFLTLIIAHHLSIGGDTLEMMQAVLDSNFWLTTHVITVNMGYGGTIFAGVIAWIYVIKGVLTRSLDEGTRKTLVKMVYNSTAFALIFMVIGTILGGVWADQSWGRFWGWDPKENGALLIILWLSIILHARLGGMIKEKGLMVLTIGNNIVTSFSWFGVNMLGIGLHSYGFTSAGFFWLTLFIFSQLILIWLAVLPDRFWRSLQVKDSI